MTINEKIDRLTRDFTTAIPKPKSMVRQELIELCRMVIGELLLEEKHIPKYLEDAKFSDIDILKTGYNACLSTIKQRAEELLNK